MSLKIMTWNALLLPSPSGFFKRFRKSQHARLGYIVDYLKGLDADLLVLQEVLMKKAIHAFQTELKEKFPYQIAPPPSGLHYSSGGMMLSRIPLESVGDLVYKHKINLDRCLKKGATLAKINWEGQEILVLGTHVQSGKSAASQAIRAKQFREIAAFIKQQNPKQLPIIFAGDMNTRRDEIPQYEDMLQSLAAVDFETDQPNLTINVENQWNKKTKDMKIDYLLLNPQNSKLDFADQHILKPQAQHEGEMLDLSDHYPLVGRLKRGKV